MLANPGAYTVRVVRNPFDMSDFIDLPSEEGSFKSLEQLLSRVDSPVAVSINGGLIEENSFAATYPQKDDFVTIVPIPLGGGGGGKSILRMVALIALSVYAPGLGQAMAGGVAGTAANIYTAAIMIGGSMLINALLPPPMPEMGDIGFDNVEDSPTYGIDGAKNTSSDGIAIPLCYGGFRMAGNIIAMHSVNASDSQDLYMLMNFGEGEIAGISDIQINKQAIDKFEGISISSRNGTSDQSTIGWFNKTYRPVQVAVKLDEDWTVRDTTQEVDGVRLDVSFPRGLQKINSTDGKKQNYSVTVEAKVLGKNTGHTAAKVETYTKKTTSVVRKSIEFTELPEDEYTVSIKRSNAQSTSQYVSDEVTVTDLNEVTDEKVNYKHTALLGVKVRLSDQLSGRPTVTAINQGIKIDTWNGSAWVKEASSNPAWIAFDMMTNTRYGGGIPLSRIDVEAFKQWAAFCDDQGLEFNGVIDGTTNVWDGLQPVFRVGHAKIVMMGTRYTVSVEKADTPTMMFSQANIIKDSFSIEWLPLEDRANEVEVAFFNKDKDYERDAVRLYDQDAIDRGAVQRLNSMTLLGVTSAKQAHYEAEIALNMNRFIKQTVTFDAHVNAIACRIGDVVYVQHDMPQWGYSGRVMPGSTDSKLVITEELSDSNTILVRRSAQKLYDTTVAALAGEIVYLTGFDGNDAVKRFYTQAGDDLEVLGTTYSGVNGWGVVLAEAPYVSIGSSVELWDTDIMEERTFWVDGDGYANLTQPLSALPDDYADYMAGKSQKMKKPFRITGISNNGQLIRSMTAVEYNESVYDRNITFAENPNYSSIETNAHTEITGVDETLTGLAGGLDTKITVNLYNDNSAYYQSAVEYSSDLGSTWQQAGMGDGQVSFMAATNDTLYIRAIAYNVLGSPMDRATAPIAVYEVQGKFAPPAKVENLGFKMVLGGIELYWDENTDLDIKGYRVRKGSSWESGEEVNSLVQTTKLFVPITEAGDFTYHLRAVDLYASESADVTSIDVSIGRPDTVSGFAAVRNGAQINMVWNRLDDQNIMEYEVREGASWGESVLVTKRVGNSYVMPTTITTSRTFWIKARHFTGMESSVAAFTIINEHIDQNRNIVFEEDHVALSWPGVQKSVIEAPDSSNIRMVDEKQHSEYHAHVTLPAEFTAHNTLELGLLAQVTSNVTMGDLDYSSEDSRANAPFTQAGDFGNVTAESFIAQSATGVAKGDFDISLNNSVTDLQASATPTSSTMTYEQGRFFDGARLNATTQLSWDITHGSEFKIQAWHVFKDYATEGLLKLWTITAGGADIDVIYRPETGEIVAQWPDAVEVQVNFPLTVDDEVLLVLIQTATTRKLMVGKSNGDYDVGEKLAAPYGSVTKLSVAS